MANGTVPYEEMCQIRSRDDHMIGSEKSAAEKNLEQTGLSIMAGK
jgi:hypothetical protein